MTPVRHPPAASPARPARLAFSALVHARHESPHRAATTPRTLPSSPPRDDGHSSSRASRGARDRDHDRDDAASRGPDEAPPVGLDPLSRALALGQPTLLATTPPTTAPAAVSVHASSIDQLAERLLRRVALGGTRHRGTALLEVGAGLLQGASIVVTAEGGALSVRVDGPASAEARAWGEGLERRLRERGVEAEVTFA